MGSRRRVMAKAPAPRPSDRDLKLPTSAVSISGPDAYRLLSSALLWVSDDETRPHIRQVLVERADGKVSIAATNGHGMFFSEAVPLESTRSEEDFSFAICSADVRAILRLISDRKDPAARDPERLRVSPRGNELRAEVGRYSFTFAPGGDFPPFRRVVPKQKKETRASVSIQGKYIALAARSFPGSAKNCLREMRFSMSGEELDAIRIDGLLGTVSASVILMPMRSSL